MNKIVYPVKIISESLVENSQALLKEKPMQIGLNEADLTTVNEGAYVILDFEKEMCGGVRILTFHADMVKIRIRFGESLTESCSNLGKKNSTNDHSLRDFETTLCNYSDMTFGSTGYRFVRIDFMGNATIKSIVGTNSILEKQQIYNYVGEKIDDDIFNIAKRTIDLCAQSGLVWDGVKRDRLVWMGDMHPEMLAMTTLYGRCKEFENSLDFVKDQYPLPNFMCCFSSYSMWWLIIIADYLDRTGAEDFVIEQLDYASGLVEYLDTFVDENGNMNYPEYFLDWPTFETSAAVSGVRALNILAMKRAISLFKRFNRSTEVAEKLLNKLNKIEIECYEKKQVIAMKYFALGNISDKEKAQLLAGGAKGLSTFMSYYVLTAIASFDKESAIKIMREYYGKMIELGATTFWEDFDIKWVDNCSRIDEFPKKNQKDIHGDCGAYCYEGFRHSLCHGWSSGVICFLKENK